MSSGDFFAALGLVALWFHAPLWITLAFFGLMVLAIIVALVESE